MLYNGTISGHLPLTNLPKRSSNGNLIRHVSDDVPLVTISGILSWHPLTESSPTANSFEGDLKWLDKGERVPR